MTTLSYSLDVLKSIGTITNITFKNIVFSTDQYPKYLLDIEYETKSVKPETRSLLEPIKNIDIFNRHIYIQNVLVNYEDIKKIFSEFNVKTYKYNNKKIITFKDLNISEFNNRYEEKDIKNIICFLYSQNKEQTFKLANNVLGIIYRNTMYTFEAKYINDSYRNTLNESVYELFEQGWSPLFKNHKYFNNFKSRFINSILKNIFYDPNTIILDDGDIEYKGNIYKSHKDILKDLTFIKEHIIPLCIKP